MNDDAILSTHDLTLMDRLDARRLVLGDGRLYIDE